MSSPPSDSRLASATSSGLQVSPNPTSEGEMQVQDQQEPRNSPQETLPHMLENLNLEDSTNANPPNQVDSPINERIEVPDESIQDDRLQPPSSHAGLGELAQRAGHFPSVVMGPPGESFGSFLRRAMEATMQDVFANAAVTQSDRPASTSGGTGGYLVSARFFVERIGPTAAGFNTTTITLNISGEGEMLEFSSAGAIQQPAVLDEEHNAEDDESEDESMPPLIAPPPPTAELQPAPRLGPIFMGMWGGGRSDADQQLQRHLGIFDAARVETLASIQEGAESGDVDAQRKIDQFAINECHICKDPYNKPVTTNCGHVFCKECIVPWLLESRKCPYCKQYARVRHLSTITNKEDSENGGDTEKKSEQGEDGKGQDEPEQEE